VDGAARAGTIPKEICEEDNAGLDFRSVILIIFKKRTLIKLNDAYQRIK
jgi:hypothetical protein